MIWPKQFEPPEHLYTVYAIYFAGGGGGGGWGGGGGYFRELRDSGVIANSTTHKN